MLENKRFVKLGEETNPPIKNKLNKRNILFIFCGIFLFVLIIFLVFYFLKESKKNETNLYKFLNSKPLVSLNKLKVDLDNISEQKDKEIVEDKKIEAAEEIIDMPPGKIIKPSVDINKIVENNKKIDKTDREEYLKSFTVGVQLFMNKKYDEAIQIFDSCIEIDPNYHIFYYYKASSLYNLGKYKEALDAINISLNLSPNDQVVKDLKLSIEKKLN